MHAVSLGQMAKSMEGSPCWMELSPASHVHNTLEATPALHLATDRQESRFAFRVMPKMSRRQVTPGMHTIIQTLQPFGSCDWEKSGQLTPCKTTSGRYLLCEHGPCLGGAPEPCAEPANEAGWMHHQAAQEKQRPVIFEGSALPQGGESTRSGARWGGLGPKVLQDPGRHSLDCLPASGEPSASQEALRKSCAIAICCLSQRLDHGKEDPDPLSSTSASMTGSRFGVMDS